MQTEQLLPCPFCGYRAHAVQAQPEIRQEEWVTCLSCFTEITGDGAIARWNSRVEPDARIAELTKAYVSELDELAERNYKLRFELAALKAQLSTGVVDDWVLADERLPIDWSEPDGKVEVIVSDGHSTATAIFFKRRNTRGWKRCEYHCVSMWRALPEYRNASIS